jgi:hypothetical protein
MLKMSADGPGCQPVPLQPSRPQLTESARST